MQRRLAILPACLGAGALALAACADPGGPAGEAGIHILAGADVEAPVFAELEQGLVIEVRGPGGEPEPGVEIRLEVDPIVEGSTAYSPLSLRTLDGRLVHYGLTDVTDARGRYVVQIVFGLYAVETGVIIKVPAFEYEDTARYTILPGAADRVEVLPADSALYVGNSYVLRPAVLDAWGNVREDPIELRAGTPDVTVSQDGTVTAHAIARTFVTASSGELADTAWISVVPRGTLAAVLEDYSSADTTTLVMFELDGSDERELRQLPGSANDVYPTWSPAGDRLLYHHGTLWLAPPVGASERAVPEHPFYEREHRGQFSRDGTWIYFDRARKSTGPLDITLWRVRADGTAAAQIGPAERDHLVDAGPSPSPDGSRVVFYAEIDRTYWLHVLDVSSGVVTPLGVPGRLPRWSPTDDLIAYTHDGVLYLIRPDGTGQRALSAPDAWYHDGLGWSPDGQWIAAVRGPSNAGKMLHILHAETGLTLPLEYTRRGIGQPAWRP